MVMSADGSEVRVVGHGQWRTSTPTWSATASSLAWVEGSSVFIAAADGSGARRVFSTTLVYTAPLWGPGGTRPRDRRRDAASLRRDLLRSRHGSGLRRRGDAARSGAPGNPLSDINPTRSPDGAWVAYVDRGRIRAVRVADSTQMALTRPPDGDSTASLPGRRTDARSPSSGLVCGRVTTGAGAATAVRRGQRRRCGTAGRTRGCAGLVLPVRPRPVDP